jgi:hypothetical protein
VPASAAPTSCPNCGAEGASISTLPDGSIYCYEERRYTYQPSGQQTGGPSLGRQDPTVGSQESPGAAAGWYSDPWGSPQRRWWNGSSWGVLENAASRSRHEVNLLALVVVGVGAFVVLIGIFLPEFEDTGSIFTRVQQNSLVQTGDGLLFLGAAIWAAGAAFWAWRRGTRNVTALILGVLIVIGLIAYSQSDQFKLYPIDSNGNADTSRPGQQANPGIGVWVTGVGAGLIALGGLWIVTSPSEGAGAARRQAIAQQQAQLGQQAYVGAAAEPERPSGTTAVAGAMAQSPSLAAEDTKRCPDCAETVKRDARVCRFCGYRFDQANPERPTA